MTPGFNLKLSVTPEGLRKLVRKNVHEKGFFHLKMTTLDHLRQKSIPITY